MASNPYESASWDPLKTFKSDAAYFEKSLDDIDDWGVDQALRFFEAQGYDPSDEELDAKVDEFVNPQYETLYSMYDRNMDITKSYLERKSPEMVMDAQGPIPMGQQEGYSQEKRPRNPDDIARQALTLAANPEEEAQILYHYDDPQWLQKKYPDLEMYDYGEPLSADQKATGGLFGYGKKVFDYAMRIPTAFQRAAITTATSRGEDYFANKQPITLDELSALEQEYQTKADERRAQARSGAGYGPGSSERMYRHAGGDINPIEVLSSRRTMGAQEPTEDYSGLSALWEGVKALPKSIEDPAAHFHKISANAREWYRTQAEDLVEQRGGENLSDEEWETEVRRIERLLVGSDEYRREIVSPDEAEFWYGMATDPAMAKAGSALSKGVSSGIKLGKQAATVPKVLSQAESLGETKGLRQAFKEAGEAVDTNKYIAEELGLAASRGAAVSENWDAQMELAEKLTDKKLPKGMNREEFYRYAKDQPIDRQLTEEELWEFETYRQAYRESMEEAANILKEGRVLQRVEDGKVVQVERNRYVPAEEKIPSVKKAEKELRAAKPKFFRRTIEEVEGIEQAQKARESELVQDVAAQLKASRKHQKKNVEARAFFGEAVKEFRKKGLAITTDDLGITSFVRADESALVKYQKQLKGTKASKKELEKTLLDAAHRQHPGVEFSILSGEEAKKWLATGMEVGEEISDDVMAVMPRALIKAAEDRLATPGILSDALREIVHPINQTFKNLVIGPYALKYAAASNGIGNMGMLYTARGLRGVGMAPEAMKHVPMGQKAQGLLFKLLRKDFDGSELAKRMYTTSTGQQVSIGEMVDYAKKYGIVDHAKARQAAATLKLSNFKTLNPLKQIQNVTDVMAAPAYAMGAFFDETNRLATFMSLVKDGSEASMRQAAKLTLDLTGNFKNMHPWEKDFFQYSVAFYQWQKFSTEWFLKNVTKNPDKFAQFERLVHYANSKINPDKPLPAQEVPNFAETRGGPTKIPDTEYDEKGRLQFRAFETPRGMGQTLTGDMLDTTAPHFNALLMLITQKDHLTGQPLPEHLMAPETIPLLKSGDFDKALKANQQYGIAREMGGILRPARTASRAFMNIIDLLDSNGYTEMSAMYKALSTIEQVEISRFLGDPQYMTTPYEPFFENLKLKETHKAGYRGKKELKKSLPIDK